MHAAAGVQVMLASRPGATSAADGNAASASSGGGGGGGGGAGGGKDGMGLDTLLHDLLLPLASLGQSFDQAEMYTLALGHWSRRGWEGLDARAAALLLNSYARNTSWPAVPALRQVRVAARRVRAGAHTAS
jgi:hypothetical protein